MKQRLCWPQPKRVKSKNGKWSKKKWELWSKGWLSPKPWLSLIGHLHWAPSQLPAFACNPGNPSSGDISRVRQGQVWCSKQWCVQLQSARAVGPTGPHDLPASHGLISDAHSPSCCSADSWVCSTVLPCNIFNVHLHLEETLPGKMHLRQTELTCHSNCTGWGVKRTH